MHPDSILWRRLDTRVVSKGLWCVVSIPPVLAKYLNPVASLNDLQIVEHPLHQRAGNRAI